MPNDLPDRYDVERMVEGSGLPTCSRDILYALARRMDQGSILIPRRYSPSLYRMSEVTGWSKRHIQRHLNRLEREGIVYRGRDKGRRTAYAVVWPALEKLGTPRPQNTRDTESPPLETPRLSTRDTVTPKLGTRGLETRDTEARSQTSQISPAVETDPEITMIRRLLMARTGKAVTDDWAAATRDTVLRSAGAPSARGPARSTFIRQAITRDTHPERWLPTPTPPQYHGEESS